MRHGAGEAFWPPSASPPWSRPRVSPQARSSAPSPQLLGSWGSPFLARVRRRSRWRSRVQRSGSRSCGRYDARRRDYANRGDDADGRRRHACDDCPERLGRRSLCRPDPGQRSSRARLAARALRAEDGSCAVAGPGQGPNPRLATRHDAGSLLITPGAVGRSFRLPLQFL